MHYDLSWAALSLAGLVTGAGIVGVLVLPQWKTPIAGVVFLGGFVGSVWIFGAISLEYGSAGGYVLGLLIALASTSGGYAVVSAFLERLARGDGGLTMPSPAGNDTALIVLACAEPDSYTTRAAARELSELQEEGTVDLTLGITPFLFAAHKARYRSIGGTSPARAEVRRLAEHIEEIAGRDRCQHVDVAWCSGEHRLAAQVASAATLGCSRIVVVPLAVAESLEMHHAKQVLDRARPEVTGVRIAYARPLQDSEEIARLVARRIAVGIAGPHTTGVALVAHGQPDTRERDNAAYDVGESAFVNRVRMMVAEYGVPESQMLVAWAEWREPGIASTVRHLAALGCDRILVSPVCFPFESLTTRLDIPLGVRQARLDPMVSVVTLSSWGDEPEVTSALIARAAEAYEELARPRR